MKDTETGCPPRLPWNKGKITGPKPPLRPGHVWAIRAKLHLEKRTRELAMFNLAIDSKLRGCDLVALHVDDVAPNGYAIDRANVRQRKTGRGHAAGSRRLPSRCRAQAQRVPVSRTSRSGEALDDAPVCPAGIKVGCRHWPRSK